MERLTRRVSEDCIELSAKANSAQYSGLPQRVHVNHPFWNVFKRLCEYEDTEEQGLLLKLPCKAGDTVWDNDFGRPCSYRITGYSFGIAEDYIDEPVTETEIVYYYINSSGGITGSFASSEIGKTVFLTKEEAEQKLAELRGGENE